MNLELLQKKLTFSDGKTSNKKFLQLFEISIIQKSQEGFERGPD